ncbi:hypothetical protein NE236_43015 [Actinoallomurus purpureus]|uniref:hypothetical protein n=1 Tax=Actinoallomurus purpureus TaxID=478114 RepID=UPI002093153D|nr:hypothetical protein [Actinoallomurus purpureus]MCO6011739.1 hypothetical protein [Actinoallomurus purpureus]
MPLSPEELARRRVANRAAHYAAKQARAGTPLERVTAAWEQWRALVRDLPAEAAEPWAEAITTTLDAHITKLIKLVAEAEGGPR